MDIKTIHKNNNGFDFIETLGSFINNIQYRQGNEEALMRKNTAKAYIWNALSAIGQEYSDTIYENVVNYLDNVGNVDLCKVKALQSMLQIIGVNYNVIDTFNTIPVELANIIDLLSINKSYLLDSHVFNDAFVNELSASGCIVKTSSENTLSNMLSADVLSATTFKDTYIDEDKYKAFLQNVYMEMLCKYVYMKYADAENGIASVDNEYIYEYLQEQMFANSSDANNVSQTAHERNIAELKLRYNISKTFDQSKIVDDIESSLDSIDNYNAYEQEIIKQEISYREKTYSFSKHYSDTDNAFYGFNLTRYSYYREKKFKEYCKYIEDTYNRLIITKDIIKNINDDSIISEYDKDSDYFNVNQTQKTLFTYDIDQKQIVIETSYITAVAQLLAEQTLEIAEIRNYIKTHIRKSYMRGTFLLLSYIVNEYLKNNIQKPYGESFSTAEGLMLKDMLSTSIYQGGNVELIEYYDNTEYYNITTPNDSHALCSETVNEKFWDNAYDKIGKVTTDIPIDEIENFYLNQMKLKTRDNIDDIVNFLSIVYEYGANDSYINKDTKEFTCRLRDGRLVGNPDAEVKRYEKLKQQIYDISSTIQNYVLNGYVEEFTEISDQLSNLSSFAYTYYKNEISNANDELYDSKLEEFDSKANELIELGEKLNKLSADYEAMKVSDEYKHYINGTDPDNQYEELENAFFIEKLNNFDLSINSKIRWENVAIKASLANIQSYYSQLYDFVYNKLIDLSVRGSNSGSQYSYWEYYVPPANAELTAVTGDIVQYLSEQIDVQDDLAMKHVQSHYDMLLSYKNEMNQVLTECDKAYGKYQAMLDAVEAVTMTTMSEDFQTSAVIFTDPIITYDSDGDEDTTSKYLSQTSSFYSPRINQTDTLEQKLDKLQQRSQIPMFSQPAKLKGLNEATDSPDNVTHFTSRKLKSKNGSTYYKYSYVYQAHIGYMRDAVQKPWAGAYSQSTAAEIISILQNAVANLRAYVQLINNELQCLNFDQIVIGNVTTDNVKDMTSNAYQSLIDRVTRLGTIIKAGNNRVNGWYSIANDHGDTNLCQYAKRLDRILAITDNMPQAYNVSYINQQFNQLNMNFQQLLDANADYFSSFMNVDTDPIDKQINDMYAFIEKKDKGQKANAISTVNDFKKQYADLMTDFNAQLPMLARDEANSVNGDYSYGISSVLYYSEVFSQISNVSKPYTVTRYKDCLDYLLSGNYISQTDKQVLSGTIQWLSTYAVQKFEDSASKTIAASIPSLPEYIKVIDTIQQLQNNLLADSLDDTELLSRKLQQVIDQIDEDIEFVKDQVDEYNARKEVFLKYNGTQIGYDPFYNNKNLAYSSYQIHPYLYNFIEKSNMVYPLAQAFYVSFSSSYESELYQNSIDKLLGRYGNIKDLHKSGMFDWTSYQSKAEKECSKAKQTKNSLYDIGFTGLFYPPAVDAFLSNPEKFIQDVEDNNDQSYYHHLNLTPEQLKKITQQLIKYQDAIRIMAQRRKDGISPSLANEFDIYKYAEDYAGNSIFLLKSYAYLHQMHLVHERYQPSYNEKKNAFGEIWMRIKNHPIAFPAFDLRQGYEEYSQYNIEKTVNGNGKSINKYIIDLNQYFESCASLPTGLKTADNVDITFDDLTQDCISQSTKFEKQHLRCFIDMELDPSLRSILLVVPMYTGTTHEKLRSNTKPNYQLMTYANSSIVVAYLDQNFDYNDNIQIFNFTNDIYLNSNVNVDNISNLKMLVEAKDGRIVPANSIQLDGKGLYNENTQIYTQFVGFAKHESCIYAIFARKYTLWDSLCRYEYKQGKYVKKSNAALTIEYALYKCHSSIIRKTASSNELQYDIFSYKITPIKNNAHPGEEASFYKNTGNLVLTYDDTMLTLGFITELTQKPDYKDNTSIVNFAEYSSMVEDKNEVSVYGENQMYPASTAMVQTDDTQKINIYNSFDSFIQHLVNVQFNFSGYELRAKDNMYFNLNSDIGFMPQYADYAGKTRMYKNSSLSSQNMYQIEMLGLEKTDLAYTPIIEDVGAEKHGRVVEDYKQFNTFQMFSNELSIMPNTLEQQFDFMLSSLFIEEEYESMMQTDELLRYKYILYNTNYETMPISKGDLSVGVQQNLYQGSDLLDILSGDDVIGPNKITYKDLNATNHVNNIASIDVSIIKDEETFLPIGLNVKMTANRVNPECQILPKNQFRLFIYARNNIKSYDMYHLFENANSNLSGSENTSLSTDEIYQIDFKEMSSISDYVLPGTDKKPFANLSNVSTPNQMSAMLEFKYSEEDFINREFPYLDNVDIEDEINIQQNNDQNTYFIALDSFDSVDTKSFRMSAYNPDTGRYGTYKIVPSLPKYRDFYNRALTIQATYNVEKVDGKYTIVEYFNYKNFTDPQYYSYESDGQNPPKSSVYKSTDKEIADTWLQLNPGESGMLNIRLEFVKFGKIKDTDINQSVLGQHVQNVVQYYVMNVSDDKPKFIISRKPFNISSKLEEEDDNYETTSSYANGMKFRYIMMVVSSTRSVEDASAFKYVALSKIKFLNRSKLSDSRNIFQFNSKATMSIAGGNTVVPNYPSNLIDYSDDKTEFFASNIDFNVNSLSIIIDNKEDSFDVYEYPYWQWYNSHCSNSHVGYIPRHFYLAVSQDQVNWFKVDEFDDAKNSIPTSNYGLAYTGTLSLD